MGFPFLLSEGQELKLLLMVTSSSAEAQEWAFAFLLFLMTAPTRASAVCWFGSGCSCSVLGGCCGQGLSPQQGTEMCRRHQGEVGPWGSGSQAVPSPSALPDISPPVCSRAVSAAPGLRPAATEVLPAGIKHLRPLPAQLPGGQPWTLPAGEALTQWYVHRPYFSPAPHGRGSRGHARGPELGARWHQLWHSPSPSLIPIPGNKEPVLGVPRGRPFLLDGHL